MNTRTMPDRDALGRFKSKLLEKVSSKTVSIESLTKKYDLIPTLVEVPNGKLPPFLLDKKENYLKSNLIIITSIYKYSDINYYINFKYFDGTSGAEHVDSNFRVKIPNDKNLIEKFNQWKIDNLYLKIFYNGAIESTGEIFVEDKEGKCIPSSLFVGTKEKPSRTLKTEFGFCPMYANGDATKFTTKDNTCLGWHMDSIAAGVKGVYRSAKNKFPESRLSLISANCDNSKAENININNIYGLSKKDKTYNQIAGSSIDFIVKKPTIKKLTRIIKALDSVLAVSFVSLFGNLNNKVFAELPGSYLLDYDKLSYYTLSNLWLCHPFITNLTLDFARWVFAFGDSNFYPSVWKASEEETLNTIINNDVDFARKIMEINKNILLALFRGSYRWASNRDLEAIYNIFLNGASYILDNYLDLEKNWNLKSKWISHSNGNNKNVLSVITNYRNSSFNKDFKI